MQYIAQEARGTYLHYVYQLGVLFNLFYATQLI